LAHAPSSVTTHVFAVRPARADPVAERLRGLAESWVQVGHLDDASLDRTIRESRIDILIETSGHTGDNRLMALTRKPAPLIVSAIGYPGSTGLGTVDARLADFITDPPGAQTHSTETLLRIEPCFLCYRPPDDAPEPEMPSDAAVTFGSFNASHKISASTAALWGEVLKAVPGSRLILKSSDLRDSGSARELMGRLAAAGLDAGRLDILKGTTTVREHLATYSRVHIALDTFPYNGTTTTCEALHMSVPVVTLTGDRHASRVGSSLLGAAGHPEWVAGSPGGFIHIAAKLAGDVGQIKGLRQSLRGELAASALCDAPAYAARVYEALRGLWRDHCRMRKEVP
jgi:protein O-GlcNAc transferase